MTLLELFRSAFYPLDLLVGGALPVVLYLCLRTGRVDRFVWRLFWLGVCLGLCWELPMQAANQLGEPWAVHRHLQEPPHWLLVVASHSLWDGGLFLVGVRILEPLCGPPVLERFRGWELAVLVAWGQASELFVELTAITGQAWAYIPRPWNPSQLKFLGSDITLLPQLIWLVAPVVFYLAALRLRRLA